MPEAAWAEISDIKRSSGRVAFASPEDQLGHPRGCIGLGSNADVAQDGARHLREEPLDEVIYFSNRNLNHLTRGCHDRPMSR